MAISRQITIESRTTPGGVTEITIRRGVIQDRLKIRILQPAEGEDIIQIYGNIAPLEENEGPMDIHLGEERGYKTKFDLTEPYRDDQE